MAFGADLEIRSWNAELERLTGIPASEAIGRPCWQVLAAVDAEGGVVCHAGCAEARLACQGWPVRTRRVFIKTAEGRKEVDLSTVVSFDAGGCTMLHLIHNGPVEPEAVEAPESVLTPRQTQILQLLAGGRPAKVIARELGIAETTTRNHIRGILVELGAHSQLEAIAVARERGLLA